MGTSFDIALGAALMLLISWGLLERRVLSANRRSVWARCGLCVVTFVLILWMVEPSSIS
jgi:hypothetical protein